MKELFAGALEGMNGILKEHISLTDKNRNEGYEIVIRSSDETALLIDFLSEALTMSYEKRKIFTGLKILELKTHFIKAIIYGTPVESFDDDIKAVTYHMAEVKKNKSGKWQTRIVFDI